MWNFVSDVTAKIGVFKIKLFSKKQIVFFHLWIIRNSNDGTLDPYRKKLFYAFGLCKNYYISHNRNMLIFTM